MRAVRLHGVGDLRITDDPMPQEIEGYTRARIGAVGLCGSDLHWFSEGGIGDVRIEHPSIPGHEQGGVALDGPHAGRVVAIDPPEEDEYAFPASAVRRKGLTIAVVRRMKDVYPRAIALVERGQVDVRAVVSHRFDLADAGEAFAFAAGRGGLKVLITSGDAVAHSDPPRGARVGGDPT